MLRIDTDDVLLRVGDLQVHRTWLVMEAKINTKQSLFSTRASRDGSEKQAITYCLLLLKTVYIIPIDRDYRGLVDGPLLGLPKLFLI